MNKIAIVFIIVLMTISIVYAQEELPNPGLLPDHPFYPVKIFFEKVRLWFAFSPEAKAKLHLEYSLQRLSELNTTIAQGKLRDAERLRNDYENELRESEAETNRSLGLGRNITDLAEHVCNMTYKHVYVLERVLVKAPNSSKPVIERVINASIERHEICLERILERVNKTEERVRKFNCTNDTDCRHLICPMVIGSDMPICKEGKCTCGPKWELNRTEWEERFGEEWKNVSLPVIHKIKEKIRAH